MVRFLFNFSHIEVIYFSLGTTLPALFFPILKMVTLSYGNLNVTFVLAGVNVLVYVVVYYMNNAYIQHYIYCADDIADQTETVRRIAMDRYQKTTFKEFRRVALILSSPLTIVFLNETLICTIGRLFSLYYPYDDTDISDTVIGMIQFTAQALGILSIAFDVLRIRHHSMIKLTFSYLLCLVYAFMNIADLSMLKNKTIWPSGLLLVSVVIGNTQASIYTEGTLIGDEKTKKIAGVIMFMAHGFGFVYSRVLSEVIFL